MALKIKAVEKLVKFNKNDAGEVIKAWATEGHSVAISGMGTDSRRATIEKERLHRAAALFALSLI